MTDSKKEQRQALNRFNPEIEELKRRTAALEKEIVLLVWAIAAAAAAVAAVLLVCM